MEEKGKYLRKDHRIFGKTKSHCKVVATLARMAYRTDRPVRSPERTGATGAMFLWLPGDYGPEASNKHFGLH